MTYPGEIIDAHQHFWQLSRSYPWLQGPADPDRFTGDDSAIRTDYLPGDLRRDFAGLNLVGTVHIDAGAGDPREEADWLQGLHDTGGLPSVMVAGADLLADDAPAHLEHLATLPAVRGVRHILNWHADPNATYVDRDDLMRDSAWLRGFSRLAAAELSFDLQIYPDQMADAARLAADHPGTTIVLNHTGMPLERSAEQLERWAEGMRALAAQPNTAVKISGLGMVDHTWSVASIRTFVQRSIECFGPARSMFASNFPVDRLYSDLGTLYEAFDEVSAEYSAAERADLFAGTARRVYRIDPAQDGRDR